MKSTYKNLKIICLLLLVKFLTSNTLQAQDYLLSNEEQLSFLSKFNQHYELAIKKGNPAILETYWANDLRIMPEYQKTIMGKANAFKYQKAFANRFEVLDYQRKKLEVLNLGLMIVEFGTFTMQLKLKENGQAYTLLGNYGNFWKLQSTGDLLLVTETWNYSERVECAPQLVFDEVPIVHTATKAHLPVKEPISFEIKAFNSFTEEIIAQHDADLWGQLYGNDCKLIYSNHPIYSGKEEINTFLAAHVKELPTFEKLDIRTDQIENLGDYIVEYSSHIAIIKDGDWSGVGTGKNIVIWKRQSDCSLKVFRNMAMYD